MAKKEDDMLRARSILALICNDIENVLFYKVDGTKCYHEDKYIGELTEKETANGLDVYFEPVKPIEYITVNITVEAKK